jgi:hypothetical protein
LSYVILQRIHGALLSHNIKMLQAAKHFVKHKTLWRIIYKEAKPRKLGLICLSVFHTLYTSEVYLVYLA